VFSFVGAEHAEIAHVRLHDVAQEHAQGLGVLRLDLSRLGDLDAVVAKIGHAQGLLEDAAVGVGVGAHAPVTFGRQFTQCRLRRAFGAEQRLRLVAAHPLFQQLEVGRVLLHVGDGHLVGAPEAFHLVTIHFAGRAPALGGAQDDHRPARPVRHALAAGFFLGGADGADAQVQGRRHGLVHGLGVRTFDEIGGVAVAIEQVFQLLVADARQQGGVVDLVAVEVEDGQHRAVADGVEELADVPGGGQGPVSASPSPTTAATIRSGLSEAAPQAWDST